MNKIRLPQLLYFGLIFILTACQAIGQSSSATMLKPGDIVDGMSLTTGAQDAPPLWAFCSSAQHSGHATTYECSVPVLPRLAIGHVFMLSDDTSRDLGWSEFTWQLSIDDRPVDLDTFGTFDYATPRMSKSPSQVREVFKIFTAWDLVLTHLTPGEHTLLGSAQMDTEIYSWVIHLTIKGNNLGIGRT